MGRHVISVTLTGHNADLNRSLRESAREVDKFSRRMKSLTKGLDVDTKGIANAIDRLKDREIFRTKTMNSINNFLSKMRQIPLSVIGAIAALGAMPAILNVVRVALGLTASALLAFAPAAVAVGAAMLVMGDRTKQMFKNLGTYIQKDLPKQLKGFTRELDSLPAYFAGVYNKSRYLIRALDEPLSRVIRIFKQTFEPIVRSILIAINDIVRAGMPFFEQLMHNLPFLIDGIRRFFLGIAGGDPKALGEAIRALGDGLADIGKWLGDQIKSGNWTKFKEDLHKLAGGFEKMQRYLDPLTRTLDAIDRALSRFGISYFDIAGGLLAIKLVAGPLTFAAGGLNKAWKGLNWTLATTTVLSGKTKDALVALHGNAKSQGMLAAVTGQTGVWSKLGTALAFVATKWQWFVGLVGGSSLGVIASFVGIAAAVGIVVYTLRDLWNNDAQFRNGMKKGWDDIKKALEPVGRAITQIFNAIGQAVQRVAAALGFKFDFKPLQDLKGVAMGAGGAIAWVYDKYKTFVKFMAGVWLSGITMTIKNFAGVFVWGSKLVVSWINWLGRQASLFAGVWKGIISFVGNVWHNVVNWISERASQFVGMLGAVTNEANGYLNNIGGFFGGLADNVTNALKWAGEKIVGFVNGIGEGVGFARNNILNMAGAFGDFPSRILSFMGAAGQHIVNFVNNIAGGIPYAAKNAASMALSIFSKLVSGIAQLPNKGWEIGKNLIMALGDGLFGWVGYAINKAGQAAYNVLLKIRRTLGIASPSKVMMSYGKFMVQGMAIGIERNAGYAIRATEVLANDIAFATQQAFKTGLQPVAAGGRATNVTYNVTVNSLQTGPEVGKTVVGAIKQYESVAGTRWRS